MTSPLKGHRNLPFRVYFTSLIVAKQSLPFNVVLPNEESRAAMLDVRVKQNLEPISLEQFTRDIDTK